MAASVRSIRQARRGGVAGAWVMQVRVLPDENMFFGQIFERLIHASNVLLLGHGSVRTDTSTHNE